MTPPTGSAVTARHDRASVTVMPPPRPDRLSEDDRAHGVHLAAALAEHRAAAKAREDELLAERNQWIAEMRAKYDHRTLPSDLADALDVDRATVHAVIKTGTYRGTWRRTTPDRGETS